MRRFTTTVLSFVGLLLLSIGAGAQGMPSAERAVRLSGFIILGDTYTGLSTPVTNRGGRNLTVTAGVDLGLYHYRQLTVAAEIRGAYPASGGHVDAQRSLLAGVRGEFRFANPRLDRLTLSADALAGGGAIAYLEGGYSTPEKLYLRSTSNVYSVGGAIAVALTNRWAVVGDVQLQRWNTPVIPSGTLFPIQGSGGLGFAFRFGGDKAQ